MVGPGVDDRLVVLNVPVLKSHSIYGVTAAVKQIGRPPDLETGSQIDDFHIVEEAGRGGIGVVFRAVDVRLDRDVAIKVLNHAGFRSEARFERESKAAGNLSNDYLVSVFS